MTIMGIDHIGIAVNSIDEALNHYVKNLGMKVVYREELKDRELFIAFLKGNLYNESYIELLEPINKENMNNTIAKFLKTKGQGLHHIALAVDNIFEEVKNMRKEGYQVIDKEPRPGAMGRLTIFIHPRSFMGVLLELVQI